MILHYFLLLGLLSFFSTSHPAEETATLKVRFENLKKAQGKMISCIYDDPEKFIYHPDAAICEGAIIRSLDGVVIVFDALPIGKYSLTAYQDENGNEKMDYNILRMPKESFGFSNNPKIVFGPPDFEEALINIRSDTTIVVTMRHF